MRRKHIFKRILALVLAASALSGLGGRLGRTEALDVSIDTSKFVTPEPDSCYLYHWHEGLPPAPKDFSTVRYPLLITWKDQYYLCTDDSFALTLNYRFTDAGVKKLRDARAINRLSDIGGEGWSERDEQEFAMGKNALLSTLDFYQSIKNKGYGATFDFMLPEIPYVCYNGNNHYALGVPQKEGSIAFDHEYNWLVAQRTHWDGKNISGLNVRHFSPEEFLDYTWSMPSDMPSTDGRVSSSKYTSVAVTLADIRDTVDSNSELNPDIFTLWRFWSSSLEEEYSADVLFHSDGTIAIGHSKGGKKLSKDNLKTLLNRMHMIFEYDGSKFIATSSAGWTKYQEAVFQVYYGEPDIVSIHHDSFTVAKGQVVNLDGPIIIGPTCTVTVKDGGVLSCAGWVINNGQILVEPGGTLLVQPRETDTGSDAYGVVTSVGTDPDSPSGRIACDGKMIVMGACKVVGAGLYGLQFGSSAQVVNYGQIISENLQCFGDHTIENRGIDSAVFAGWGVTDMGYDLSQQLITGQDYPGKGVLQETAAVKLPKNAVYGEGANRLYVNGASSVSYSQPNPSKESVSGFDAPVSESSSVDTGYTSTPLPDSIPVYYDEEYRAYYIDLYGVIYHYAEAYDRWISVRPNGRFLFYDYGMPADGREFLSGELPAGYIFYNGTSVPEEGELPVIGGLTLMDLKYDDRYSIIWFRADDGKIYHYEPELADYIYVDDSGYYHRYPDLVAPPMMTDGQYDITGDMYEHVPSEADARRYTSGMAEAGTTGGLPDQYQIYYDTEYDVFFFETDELVFHFDEWTRQWVFINYNGYRITADYAAPGSMENVQVGQLPDGILLYDDRLVDRSTPQPTTPPSPTQSPTPTPTATPRPTVPPQETFAPYEGKLKAHIQRSTGRIYCVWEDGSILWYNEEYREFSGTLRNGAYGYVEEAYVDMSEVR